MYHREIKITVVFRTSELYQDVKIIQSLYVPVAEHCQKYSWTDTAFDIITARMKNLERPVNKLKSIIHTRTKLLNIIGSVSKTLFGTLDNADLNLINENIDKLFNDQNKLTHIVQNQTSMFRQIL